MAKAALKVKPVFLHTYVGFDDTIHQHSTKRIMTLANLNENSTSCRVVGKPKSRCIEALDAVDDPTDGTHIFRGNKTSRIIYWLEVQPCPYEGIEALDLVAYSNEAPPYMIALEHKSKVHI